MSGKAGKPTARSQKYALQRKDANQASSSKTKLPDSNPKKFTEWRLHGPNLAVKKFTGMVSRSENLTTNSVASGRYFATQVKDLFKGLDQSTLAYGVVFRFCLDFANGSLGLIEDFDSSKPAPPHPLSRRKFVAKRASGVQILAPSDMTVGNIPDNLWFVVYYDKEFPDKTPVWVRTQYVQHSMPVKVDIPDSVLMTEQDAPVIWDAMDKLVS
jgi:hypothetical protein